MNEQQKKTTGKSALAPNGDDGRVCQMCTAAVADREAVASEAAVPEEAEVNLGICPYYMRDRGKGVVYCECAKFRFPDKGSRREILYRYCAHPDGYKACMIKQALDHYYERKYARYEQQSS